MDPIITGTFFVGALVAVLIIACSKLLLPKRFKPTSSSGEDRIQILVLGDIGRSPRMQYHALSILKHGGNIDIIGYKETARHPGLIGNPRVGLYPLERQPEWLEWHQGWLALPFKALWNSYALFKTLAYTTPPARWIIIQNPPSIPTLHVALIASWIRGTKLMVDWHNYGHTIMAINRSPNNPLVLMYKTYETFFGPIASDVSLTVTNAMATQLRQRPWNIRKPILTLHDRPAAMFQPVTSLAERKLFLSNLKQTKDVADSIIKGSTRLVVSSTSWTPDEDFGILLEALVNYAKPAAQDDATASIPTPLFVIITGKGPQKEDFENMIKSLQERGHLPGVTIITAWLSTREYASLLACADLGVCLHKSSSGVDLPMKIVDMFGAGLPVAAYSGYQSFGELVRDGDSGCSFETSTELEAHLRRLLGSSGKRELARLKDGAIREGARRWDDEWDGVVGKALGLVEE